MRRIVLAAAFCAASVALGCSTMPRFTLPKGETIATNAGSTNYNMGTATQVFDQNQEKVRKATLQSMRDLEVQALTIKQTVESGGEGIEGKTADGRMVKVYIEPEGSHSKVTAHVGVLGNKSYALAIVDRIGVHLGIKASASTTEDSEKLTETSEKTKPESDEANNADADTTTKNPIRKRWFSKNAVSDEVMFHDKAVESFYHDTPGGL